jgi:hypothetical protein
MKKTCKIASHVVAIKLGGSCDLLITQVNYQNNWNLFFKVEMITSSVDIMYQKKISSSSTFIVFVRSLVGFK